MGKDNGMSVDVKGELQGVVGDFSYEDFWSWFEQNAEHLYAVVKSEKNIAHDFIAPVTVQLNLLRDGFFLLAGMYSDDIAEMIITADGDVRVIPFIEELVALAPEINNWRITALKPPSERKDFEVNFSQGSLSAETLFFIHKENSKYPDLIDIEIVHHDINDANRHLFEQGIFIFLENYIGELASLEMIDYISIKAAHESTGELIPLSKLSSFLNWRRKEFVGRNNSILCESDNDAYVRIETMTDNDEILIAAINRTLLQQEHTTAYPWIAVVKILYGGDHGQPTLEDSLRLEGIEEYLSILIDDDVEFLNIGKETGENIMEIYFACKGFRKPAIILDKLCQRGWIFEIDYQIFKDKYWQFFERFR